ncbi:MAG: hypothetical protein F7B18_04190 [Desulfurococcales archaeon]|nr:hypothetical protein [Desulfurococcales archaeon]
MRSRVVGVVEAVAPMRLIIAKSRGEPPRIGARIAIKGARGRIIDVIGPIDSPYLVIRLDDPTQEDLPQGAEVVLLQKARRRARGRGRRGRSEARAMRRRGSGSRRGRKSGMRRSRG